MAYDAAVVGLGNMGQRIATCLSSEGRKITAWNRTPKIFRDADFAVSTDLAQTILGAPVLLLVLSNYEAAKSCLQPHSKLLSGKTVVLFNSGLPDHAREVSAWIEEAGGTCIDAAILGYPADIGSERVMIFYAGNQDTVGKLTADLLAPLGTRQVSVGQDLGAAKNFDAALLCRNYLWMVSYLQSLALAKQLGLDGNQFTETALSLVGPLWGNIRRAQKEIEAGTYREAEQASISVHRSALDVVTAVAAKSLIQFPVLQAAYSSVIQAENAGLGDKEMAAVYTIFEPTEDNKR